MANGPRFLDEDAAPAAPRQVSVAPSETSPAHAREMDRDAPRGPTLLEPGPEAAERLDVGWTPEVVAAPRRPVGTGFWVAAGLCTIVLSWVLLSLVSFVLALAQQSVGLGSLAAVAIVAGMAMIAFAVVSEATAYRSLSAVDRLRATLAGPETDLTIARREARAWLRHVGAGIPEAKTADRMLESAANLAELRGVVRSQVADRLRDKAGALGRRAALEGAMLVAICPHPAWDGVIAGGRGLLVIRQVAALYGLRPGLTVTLALVRRAGSAAAGTTGLSLVSQGIADHALTNMPFLKHVAGALPGTGVTAVRLYRLANVTAETCTPVPG